MDLSDIYESEELRQRLKKAGQSVIGPAIEVGPYNEADRKDLEVLLEEASYRAGIAALEYLMSSEAILKVAAKVTANMVNNKN